MVPILVVKINGTPLCTISCMDLRHLLCLLPFLFFDLLSDEVSYFNSQHGTAHTSLMNNLIITLGFALLQCYQLYR